MGRPLLIYLDTSVIGGCFDDEFSKDSQRLVAGAHAGEYQLILSDLLFDELKNAPEIVQGVIKASLQKCWKLWKSMPK